MRRRSIRFRLTVWYAVLLSVGLGLFGGLIWLSLRQRLLSEIDRDLEERAVRFEHYFKTESSLLGLDRVRDELEEFCQALPPGHYIQLRGASGFTFHFPANAPDPRAQRHIHRGQFTSNAEVFDLELGAPIGGVVHTLELLRFLLLGLTPAVIALACLGGAWLSGRALKPVQDITAAARTISIENLSERLPAPATDDELARLTEVLNSMLEKLESAVKTLSQFAADASHELRTPLAVIHTTAELALRRTRTPEGYRDSLKEITADAQRMTQLVEDLLLLARNGTSAAEMPFMAVDLRSILQDVHAEMHALADVRRIRIEMALGDTPAVLPGNGPSLHRLFTALLDNALKYSPDGGEVVVTLRTTAAGVEITIEDYGSGISETDLPHIFKRFYRADRARSGAGHGLGLSLADSVARAHGATIEVRSAEGSWSMFRVLFPIRADTAEASPKPPRVAAGV